jgi:hypothetical protein
MPPESVTANVFPGNFVLWEIIIADLILSLQAQ